MLFTSSWRRIAPRPAADALDEDLLDRRVGDEELRHPDAPIEGRSQDDLGIDVPVDVELRVVAPGPSDSNAAQLRDPAERRPLATLAVLAAVAAVKRASKGVRPDT